MTLLNKAAPTSDLVRSAMAQELAAQLLAAETKRDALLADLGEARILAEPAHRLREIAEAAWEAAGDQHSVESAQRLEQRRAEDEAATRRVASLEKQLGEVEGEIVVLKESGARERALTLAAAIWPAACTPLVAPVRALMGPIKAQRAAWEQLVQERATGAVDRDLELAIWGTGGFDDALLNELERFLAAMARAGLADGKK